MLAPTSGAEVYAYAPESANESIKLYLDQDDIIHLARVDRDNHLIPGSEVQATLSPTGLDILDAAATEVRSGALLGSFDPQCLSFVDSATVRMAIPASPTSPARVEFGYPAGCAPSSLTPVADMFQELVTSLPACESSEFYTDCSLDDG